MLRYISHREAYPHTLLQNIGRLAGCSIAGIGLGLGAMTIGAGTNTPENYSVEQGNTTYIAADQKISQQCLGAMRDDTELFSRLSSATIDSELEPCNGADDFKLEIVARQIAIEKSSEPWSQDVLKGSAMAAFIVTGVGCSIIGKSSKLDKYTPFGLTD